MVTVPIFCFLGNVGFFQLNALEFFLKYRSQGMLLPPNVVSEYELEYWSWRCIHGNKELSDESALEASCNEISEHFTCERARLLE